MGPDSHNVEVVTTRADFDRFFSLLKSTERNPMVVVSVPEGELDPPVDMEALERELADSVHLYVLPSEATYWLTDTLKNKALTVHSGWARVYPSSPDWWTTPDRAPRFRPMPWDRRQMTQRIVDAALDAAFRDGWSPESPAPTAGSRASAVVTGVLSATQALVETDRRTQALMRTNHLATGLSAERLVAPGQRFAGRLTHVGMMDEFTPDPVDEDYEQRAVEFVGDGVVTSAFVATVSFGSVRLMLHPEVDIWIVAGPGEDLTTLATEGEVVTVEVVRLEDQFLATFSADEPIPAMSVLPGGPPWIEPEARSPELAEAPPLETEGASVHPNSTTSRSMADAALEDEIERLEYRVRAADETIRLLKRELRMSRKFSVPVVYSDPERQFRLELELDYLARVAETDRLRFPWPERYHIGKEFVQTMDSMVADGGISREKIVEVCVDVLCGRAREMSSRAVKEWLTSPSGPQLIRPGDRAAAMRVRLQTGTSAARRLRYWVLTNGEVELDRVGVHDDGIL